MTTLASQLTLNEDVMLVPVKDLPPESLSQIECNADDFAISRVQGRGGSKIIDPEAADLLTCFREPRTVIEAVILFGRKKQVDPNKVLESAYPFLRNLVAEGVLVPSSSKTDGQHPQTRWAPGDSLQGGTVLRTMQVLDDTEIYLLRQPSGKFSVFKTERFSNSDASGGPARGKLARETKILKRLGGKLAPDLLDSGEIEGRLFLEMEFIPGVDTVSAAAEFRDAASHRQPLVLLACSIVSAYAELHSDGLVHGDVHPRNVLVCRDGTVRLIDFGLSRFLAPSGQDAPPNTERGGVPFFFEPELAKAYLVGSQAPLANPAGEQFAVAAMLYFLLTGNYWQNFRLAREAMLEDIASKNPLSFAERGAKPWPAMESILARAMSREAGDRFPSMEAFAEAILAGECESTPQHRHPVQLPVSEVLTDTVRSAGLEGMWLQSGLRPAPTCSITYGAAGISLGLLQIAESRSDASLLALAAIWENRAHSEMLTEGAFYNSEIEITPELVGKASPYHTPSGVHAVSAFLRRAEGNSQAQTAAIERFLNTTRGPVAGLDLTLGRASVLLGTALLLDSVSDKDMPAREALLSGGREAAENLWNDLDKQAQIAESDVEYLGIAHGWAGFLYATLLWHQISGGTIPAGSARRLTELASLAIPSGRGLEWPWMLRRRGEPPTMAGWCNGSCGYVFLWTLAHAIFGKDCYLDLATGAAWNTWESGEGAGTLCCGLAGRAYALLNLYRLTNEKVWLDRARGLATRAVQDDRIPPEYAHSLYKGQMGLAVLAADLEQPEKARMPFFETSSLR